MGLEDCQKKIYYELDDIRKMVIGDYYERNLKRTILYLIRKYMYNETISRNRTWD